MSLKKPIEPSDVGISDALILWGVVIFICAAWALKLHSMRSENVSAKRIENFRHLGMAFALIACIVATVITVQAVLNVL